MKSSLQHNYTLALLVLAVCASSIFAQVPSVATPGPNGGIVSVVRGTANDSIILIGTRSSGVYRSLNGGASWSQTTLIGSAVNDIVFHPTDLRVVFAATNDGLYQSADAGLSWSPTLQTTPISSLTIYPSNPLIMFAGDGRPKAQSKGILRTLDGGATWTQVVSGLAGNLSITSLAIDAESPPTGIDVYAGTEDAGVYRTGNTGNTWSAFNTGLPVGPGLRIHSLSITPTVVPTSVLTAGTSSGQFFGITGSQPQWSQLSNWTADPVAQSSAIVVGSAQNPTVSFYVGTKGNEESKPPSAVNGGLYRSNDLGVTWTPLFTEVLDVNSIFVPAYNIVKIYIATSDGMYVSNDGGINWDRQNLGILNSHVRTVAVMNNNPNYLFAGVYGGGILKSTNGGVTWARSNTGIDNPYVRAVLADPKNAGVLYAGSVNGVYKSIDTSRTWKKFTFTNSQHDSLSPFNNNSEDGAFRISPVNTNNLLVFALTGEFGSSTDAGVTWTPLVPPQQVTSASVIENIEFDPTNASTFYFSANGIWKTTDLGATWGSISGDLPATVTVGGGLYSLFGIHPRIDSSNTNVIYLPTIANGKQYGIYKTTNGGVNWKLLSVKAFDVSVDRTSTTTLFCAGEDGIFQSGDAGDTWVKMVGDGITKYFSISRDPLDANTVFVGSDIGITRVQYGANAALEISQTSFDFGSQPVGSLSVNNVSFKNVGQKRLAVNFSSVSGSGDFIAIPASLVVDPGTSGTIALQFTPKTAGAQQANVTFATNDPHSPTVMISVRGSGVTKFSVTRSILLETTHGISANLGSTSIAQYLSQFVQALQKSGLTVKQDQTAFDPFAATFHAILIAAPRTLYTLTEIGKLRDYVTNGGFVVMLGDTGKSEANKSLNGILSNFQWTQDPPNIPTGLSLNNDVVYDSTLNYLGVPTSPIFNAFVDSTHPFVKGVTSIVPFASSSISTTLQAISFLRASSTTSAISSDTSRTITQRPVVAALSQIGKGRILLIGDVDIWSNSIGDSLSPTLTGILAGKNLQFALNVFGYVDNYSVKLPKPTLSEKYQIISIPFDLSNFNILDVLKDLGRVDKTKWRLYGRWNGTKYLEFPSAEFLSFKRGEGYWLITKGEQNLTLGDAKISTQEGFYPIALDSGYNLIGNPFPYRVSWATSQLSTPDSVEGWLWNFTGLGFQKETSIMEPFTGYFVKSLRKGVTVYINPTEVISPGFFGKSTAEQRQFAGNEWQIQIRASNGVATDVDNVAGVLRSAKDDWDASDFSEPPPAPTDYLALSFNHREWQDNPGRYAGDFRAVHPEGNYWDFDISSAKAEANISLALDRLGNIPSDFEMVLVDMTTERVTDVKSSLSYALTLKKNEYVRSFRLIVGKPEFVQNNTNGIPIVPLAYSLDQNFPNPFNPSTKIQYTLGHSAFVQLDIFSMLGQKVRTLFAGGQRIGHYTVEWNGTNDAGATVASGIYFYRIRTEEFSSVKKMVLVR